MNLELDAMSHQELKALREGIDAALNNSAKRDRNAALEAVAATAKLHGFTLHDLILGSPEFVGKKPYRSRARGPAPQGIAGKAPYRDPSDPTRSWMGQGRYPKWLKEALTEGRSLDEFKT